MKGSGRPMYLVMDMINDLVHPDGPSGATGLGNHVRERNVIARTAAALQAARANRFLIGFVIIGFSADYRECSPMSRRFSSARERGIFRLGTWGTEIHPALPQAPDDAIIVKHRVSPFYGTDLELLLRVLAPEVVFVSGVSTNGVVHSAARDLHDRDFRCVVLEDCCASSCDGEHERAIACVEGFAEVSDSGAAFS